MANKEKPPRLQALRKIAPLDVAAVVGLASLTYGVWQMYPPAAYMVFGGILLFGAVISALIRSEQTPPSDDKRRG